MNVSAQWKVDFPCAVSVEQRIICRVLRIVWRYSSIARFEHQVGEGSELDDSPSYQTDEHFSASFWGGSIGFSIKYRRIALYFLLLVFLLTILDALFRSTFP